MVKLKISVTENMDIFLGFVIRTLDQPTKTHTLKKNAAKKNNRSW